MEGVFGYIIVMAVVGMIIFESVKSFGIIEPHQKGIKVTLGVTAEKETTGWYVAIWPIQKMVKITKKLMIFKFTVPSAVTRRGKVEGHDKIVEPLEVDIKCAIYAQLDENELSHILQYAPGYDASSLGPFLVPYAIDTVRAMAGRLPWRLINRERYKSAVWVRARLIGGKYFGIDDNDPKVEIKYKCPEGGTCKEGDSEILINELENGKSPFVTLHMKNVSFVIEDLIFSETVRLSVTAAERANLEAEATVIKAEAEKIRKTKEGQGDAEARGAMLAKIKEHPELETISAIKEIGKGQGHFIFALPESLQRFLNKLGG